MSFFLNRYVRVIAAGTPCSVGFVGQVVRCEQTEDGSELLLIEDIGSPARAFVPRTAVTVLGHGEVASLFRRCFTECSA